MDQISDEDMNKYMDQYEEKVSNAPTCPICKQVILLAVERWGKMACCKEPLHLACFKRMLDDQMNRHVASEKLYCEFCRTLCHLAKSLQTTLQDP